MKTEKFISVLILIGFIFSVGSCAAYNINKENQLAKKGITCEQISAIAGNNNTLRICSELRSLNK